MLPQTSLALDQLVARAQAAGRAPCVAAAVVRAGELAHVAGAGTVLDRPADGASVANVQFRIGSISKTMTAVLLLQLRDQGLLSLDDLLYRHLPGTPVGSNVTLRQLLAHSAGLQREPDGAWWERTDGGDIEDLLAALTPEKLALAPHHGYHYSNLAYGLLGAVLHRVTGLTWAELLQQRLLTPLGMTRTSYHPADPFAPGYVVHPWLDTLREEPRSDTGAMAPAGQLWSTPVDLTKWAAFLADPDPAILEPATLREMSAPVVMNDLDTWSGGHGLGIELYREGERVYLGHGGSMPGYLAALVVHRPSRTGVVAYANAYTLHGKSLGRLAFDMMATVLDGEPEAIAPWRPAAQPPSDVADLLGRWWWMGREYEVRHDLATGQLVLGSVTRPRPEVRFRPEGKDRWRGISGEHDGEILAVLRDGDGVPTALDIATFVFRRAPLLGD
ncbi:serine hydrolase domain-containing protein [Hamadaea sp. NPDC051192]|uniref:serine hydrolase domain-containing protein n=1 Tax=Hamadaea sp. NPDC051192 TaxID=3154940 RepID=UPI0034360E03